MHLFAEVCDLSPEQRRARLQAACGVASELHGLVEQLLANDREAERIDFLKPLLVPPDLEAGDEVPVDVPGYEMLIAPIGDGDEWPKMGGMGVVWCARDLQFQRLVAVKVMKVAESRDQDRVRQFRREACISAQLTHPSIVPVHAMGTLADGRPYYIMKFVKGERMDLLVKDLLKAGPDAASQRSTLLQVFLRVCQALAFAHSKQVIHNDLKPRNVMVGEHGEVQVMDWGEAKVLTESDGQPRAVTYQYASPEQAKGHIEHIDRRSDVFGLGAMLCEILTGNPPYIASTEEDLKQQASNAELADARERLECCGADAQLIDLARACLSPEPNDRPEDASVVEKRLTDCLASVEERLRKAKLARQRMLWLAVALATALLGLVAAGLFAWLAQAAKLKQVEAERDRLAAQQAYEAEKRQSALDRALTAAMSGDLDTAEQKTAEAERAGASAGQVHMLRGQIALHRGQSRDAIRHLKEAVRLLPNSVAARGMLAAAYADDGHWVRFDRTIREMEELTPLSAEDFLFKGYAWANLEPVQGLQMIKQAFDFDRRPRPMVGIALLLRAEVRAFVAQDTDNLEAAKGAVLDATYAREFLRDNPTAIWVSLEAHLAKAGVHEHRNQPEQRRAELELARKDADALKPFTALPEAVVFRWIYFREVGEEEKVLDEMREASKNTEHMYVTSCCALALYRRGDLKEAFDVLDRRHGTYTDRLLPIVLAELDYPDKHNWPARALKTYEEYAARTQDGAAVMDAQSVLRLLGMKEDAVKASQALLEQNDRFYTLRREPIVRCARYNAGKLKADELIQLAGSSQWDRCLAHYSVAMTKLAEGDRDGARKHFDEAVKTRASGWGEYDLSWVFRDRLDKDPNWPPRIPKKP
jgi:tetratricopeptide (TPR) repeat protein